MKRHEGAAAMARRDGWIRSARVRAAAILGACFLVSSLLGPALLPQGFGVRATQTVARPVRPAAFPLSRPVLPGGQAFVSAAAGRSHSVFLRGDGTLAGAGWNPDGRLDVASLSGIVAIAAGESHTVALRGDGGVIAIGCGDDGRTAVSGWTGMVAVAAGARHTVGLRADGTVLAAGDNGYGQCDVSGWTGIVAVAAGAYHTVGLRLDGTVVATGADESGQCRTGRFRDIVAVAASTGTTIALDASGRAFAVGRTDEGQCLVGTAADLSAVAAGDTYTLLLQGNGTLLVAGTPPDPMAADFQGRTGVAALSAGPRHALLVLQDGSAAGSGDGADGQTRLEAAAEAAWLSRPMTLAVGESFPLRASAGPGSAWAGSLRYRSLNPVVATMDGSGRVTGMKAGTTELAVETPGGSVSARLAVTVVQVLPPLARPTLPAAFPLASRDGLAAGDRHWVRSTPGGDVVAIGAGLYGSCDPARFHGGSEPVADVAAGGFGTFVLLRDGTVRGLLPIPAPTSGWSRVVQVSAGPWHVLGLTADGTVLGAGDGQDGRLEVAGWTGIVAVSAGGAHSAGLRSDGTVVTAGRNDVGQGNTSGWTGIVAVSAGGSHTVGLRSDGRVLATGDDRDGQCRVGEWTRIVAVAAGERHTVGLRADGTVLVAGRAEPGQAEIPAWADVTGVAAGSGFTVARTSDGRFLVTGGDSDLDGVPDDRDAHPLDGRRCCSQDFDRDGACEHLDDDDDNDGLPDTIDPVPAAESRLATLTLAPPAGSGTTPAPVLLVPAFSGDQAGPYRATVSATMDRIVLSAGTLHPDARTAGTGEKGLAYGENTLDVTVTAQDGSSRVYRILVTRKPPAATSTLLTVDRGEGLLSNLVRGMTAGQVKAAVSAEGGTLSVVDAAGAPVADTRVAGTGMELRVLLGSQVQERFTLIRYGDLNGDGAVNATDLLVLKRHVLAQKKLTGVHLAAANTSRDTGGAVNATDLLAMKRDILRLKDIDQS